MFMKKTYHFLFSNKCRTISLFVSTVFIGSRCLEYFICAGSLSSPSNFMRQVLVNQPLQMWKLS